MADLFDDEVTYEDIAPERPEVVVDERSRKHMAATAAYLDNDIEDTASTVADYEGSSLNAAYSPSNIVERGDQRKKVEQQQMQQETLEVLSDPSLPPEVKANAVYNVNDPDNPIYSEQAQVSRKALSSYDTGRGIPFDSEEVQNRTFAMDTALAVKENAQKLVNGYAASQDQDFTNSFADIAEVIVPFTEGTQLGSLLSKVKGLEGKEKALAMSKAIAFLGESRQELAEILDRVPYDQRIGFQNKLYQLITSNQSVLFQDSNTLATQQNLNIALNQEYSTTERVVDNIFSVLDMVGVGVAARGAKVAMKGGSLAQKAARAGEAVEDAVLGTGAIAAVNKQATKLAKKKAMKGGAEPVSTLESLKDSNPNHARAAFHILSEADDEEAALALTGVSKTDAVGEKLHMDIGDTDEIIHDEVNDINKIQDLDETPEPDSFAYHNGETQLHFKNDEKRKAYTKVTNDFQNAKGITYHHEKSQIHWDDGKDRLNIRAVYGPTEGGWDNAADAIEQTEISLRQYGVEVKDIKVGVMSGNTFVPAEMAEEILKASPKAEGVGVVRPKFVTYVNMDHKLKTRSFGDLDAPDIVMNFMNKHRILAGGKRGSLARHIFGAAAMFDKNILGGATVASERVGKIENLLRKRGDAYANKMASLAKEERELVESYIIEAKHKEIKFSATSLKDERGFTDDMVEAVESFNKTWDDIWMHRNEYLKEDYSAKGYGVFENKKGGTFLVGKKANRGDVDEASSVIGPNNEVIQLSDISEGVFKERAYEMIKLETPVDGIEYAIASNRKGEGVFRDFHSYDKVLDKKNSYYTTNYNYNLYVEQAVKTENGSYQKALGGAMSRKEAEKMLKAKAKELDIPVEELRIRPKKESAEGQAKDMDDVMTFSGQSYRKHRGEKLEDASGNTLTGVEDPHVDDPLTAMAKAISQTSRKVGMQDYLNGQRKRFMDNYGEMVATPGSFPKNMDEILEGDVRNSKVLADARTHYEYIKFLEAGYFNDLDSLTRRFLEMTAKMAGVAKWSSAEKALYGLSNVSASQEARKLAFNATIAFSPTRQVLVQSAQGLLLSSVDPVYVFSGRGLRESAGVTYLKLTDRTAGDLKKVSKFMGVKEPELKSMLRDLDRSGLLENVDRHSLTTSGLENMVQMKKSGDGVLGKAAEGGKMFADHMKKWGFTSGESMNIASAFLVFRKEALKKSGKKVLSAKEIDEVTAKARTFTLGMSRAEEMPYNSNLLAAAFQFFQVPHKMALMAMNRQLTGAERIKMFTANTLMWGSPFVVAPAAFQSLLPEDPETREWVEEGLMSQVLNGMLSLAGGEKSDVDWKSSMAPLQIDAFTELMKLNVFDMTALAGRAPATSIMKKAYDAVNFARINKYEDLDDYLNTSMEFAQIISGFSQGMRAKYAWEVGQQINRYGDLTDDHVTKAEALMAAFGLQTGDTKNRYDTLYHLSEGYQDEYVEDDVRYHYKIIKRTLLAEGVDHRAKERNGKVLRAAMDVFGSHPKHMHQIQKMMIQDVTKNNDMSLLNYFLKKSGWIDSKSFIAAVKTNARLSPQMKERLIENVEYMDKAGEVE